MIHWHELWGLPAWGVALVVGVCLGSFSGAAVWRLPRAENLLTGQSRCVVCGTGLGALELLPVLGWVLIGGRCRHCGVRVSVVYPLAEVMTALLLAGLTLVFRGEPGGLPVFWWGAAVLLITARIDAVTGLVFPVFLAWTWGIGVLLMLLPGGRGPWGGHLLGGLVAAGVFFALLWLASALMQEEAMGLGDVVLAGWIGWFVGLSAVPVWAMLSFVLGAALGAPWFLWRIYRKEPDARQIPFGPFMALAALVVWALGADWWRDLILLDVFQPG